MQSVLKRYCQSTIMGGASVRVTSHGQIARFEKGVKKKKKKTWVDFYHYRVVVYTDKHISVQTTCKSACSII